MVELHDVGQRLFSLLREAPGVTLHCPAKVEAVNRSRDSVSLTLDSGETINGKLLVAADGSRSSLGARCGISWQQQPYEQLAIIANVSTALPHEGRAFERFYRAWSAGDVADVARALFAGVVPSAVAARRGAELV